MDRATERASDRQPFVRSPSQTIVSVVNLSDGQVTDRKLQKVVRAINRQISEDFEPYWSMAATLRLEGRSESMPSKLSLSDLRGDAILYLWNELDVDGALGFHDQNARGIPYRIVFTSLSAQLGEPWSVTLSREALELVADPEANLLVRGPHPANPSRTVFHWYRMSNAVENESYNIDGVAVSNFVLPLYFTNNNEKGSRNDFLGTVTKGKTLPSFGVNPGGYIGFFDPELGKDERFTRTNDAAARKRLRIKLTLGPADPALYYLSAAPQKSERRSRRGKAVS